MERKKWSSSIWSFPIFADTRFAFIIIIVEFVARFLLFLFQGIIWMEIGGWTKRSAKKSLQIICHDTKHIGERSRNVIVSKFDCFADSISSSVRLASSRKSGEGREEWLMHKRDATLLERFPRISSYRQKEGQVVASGVAFEIFNR